MHNASMRMAGEGSTGGSGKMLGNVYRTAKALSNASCPKTIKVLVKRKNSASSISRPSHRWAPYFVPGLMIQVPRFRANVSTTQRYTVGMAMGQNVFDNGNPRMNWYARLLHEDERSNELQDKVYQP